MKENNQDINKKDSNLFTNTQNRKSSDVSDKSEDHVNLVLKQKPYFCLNDLITTPKTKGNIRAKSPSHLKDKLNASAISDNMNNSYEKVERNEKGKKTGVDEIDSYLQDLLNEKDSKYIKNILIIYTGGTIGSERSNNEGSYIPKKNFLYEYMRNHPNLCDMDYTKAMENSKITEKQPESNSKEKTIDDYNKCNFHVRDREREADIEDIMKYLNEGDPNILQKDKESAHYNLVHSHNHHHSNNSNNQNKILPSTFTIKESNLEGFDSQKLDQDQINMLNNLSNNVNKSSSFQNNNKNKDSKVNLDSYISEFDSNNKSPKIEKIKEYSNMKTNAISNTDSYFLKNLSYNHKTNYDKNNLSHIIPSQDKNASYCLETDFLNNSFSNNLNYNNNDLKKSTDNITFLNDNKELYKKLLNQSIIQEEIEFNMSQSPYSKPSNKIFTPLNTFKKRISYQIIDFDEVIDSSNISLKHWILMGKCISEHYDQFDGFVILHGTDTMSYTASILSFMFENLAKTVIITGSQIPLVEMSNDGLSNLIDSINICGTFLIPEVTIMFRGKLLRGNRTIKQDSRGLSAFDSPNFQPLIEIATVYKVNWDLILKPPSIDAKFRFFPCINTNITIFKYFPTISDEKIKKLLSSEDSGIIIETYGAGHLPSNRDKLTEILQEMQYNDVVLVNVSQCRKGLLVADYEVGKKLEKLGIVYSGDMTLECALAKLSYLLGKGLNKNEIRKVFTKSLRGEVTEFKKEFFSYKSNAIKEMLGHMLEIRKTNNNDKKADKFEELNLLSKELMPVIINKLIELNKLDSLNSLREDIMDLSKTTTLSFTKTPLHIACIEGNLLIVKFLINDCKHHINKLDEDHFTPLHYACLYQFHDVIEFVKKNGGKLNISEESYGSFYCKLALKGKTDTIKLFHKNGGNIMAFDYDRRTIAHVAAIEGNAELLEFLVHHTKYNLDIEDYIEKIPYEYANDEIKNVLRPKRNKEL